MMDAFHAVLEARDPARGRMRSYVVEAGTDMFGTWLVEITYGRIGTRGWRVQHVASDEAEARRHVKLALARRRSARKRIGVSHRFLQLADPGGWFPLPLEQG